MSSREVLFGKTLPRLLLTAVLMTVPYCLVSSVRAADMDRSAAYSIVSDSLSAMWLGEDYGPELARKQQR